MLHQVVLHPGHKLSHVSHHHVRARFFPFLRALDKIVDVLRECGRLVRCQLKGVRPYARACTPVVTISKSLQSWRG